MHRIYVSCSLDMPTMPTKVKRCFADYDAYVSYYQKGITYKKEWLEQADMVVFVLPYGNFAWDVNKLTNGVLKELIYCLNTHKPYFISYTTSDGKLGIYPAMINDELCITGIANAKNSIFTLMQNKLPGGVLAKSSEPCSKLSEGKSFEELTNFNESY